MGRGGEGEGVVCTYLFPAVLFALCSWCMYMCMYVPTYMHVHVHTYLHTCMYMCMYVPTYMHVHAIMYLCMIHLVANA